MGLAYTRPIPPCKDCEDRHIGCHSKCKQYKAFAEENRKRHDEAMKRFVVDIGLESAEIIRNQRNKRV